MTRGSFSLNPARRARDLDRLAAGHRVDLLVVGGGIVGTGVALDAASRGLDVALVERKDLASGTSRWSSKLVHGGLRYLRHLQLGLAWECAVERKILMRRTAPHLVRPLPFLSPLTPALPALPSGLLQVGARLGDGLRAASGVGRGTLPSSRRIGPIETRRLVPALSAEGLRGAVLFWEGQLEDDARLVIAVARTAAAHGARIVTHCEVEQLYAGGARARDTLSGEELEIEARQVVSATGVWADRLTDSVRLAPSKGAHLIVPAAALGEPRAAFSVPVGRDLGRFVFAVPIEDRRVLVGLTDDPYDGSALEAPAVDERDEGFLLETISAALHTPLGPDDVIGRFAGLRPLLFAEGATADLSRRHALIDDPETGAITVVGGKLTTYRRMAEDAVDRVVERAELSAGPCRSATLPLVGAGPVSTGDAPAQLWRRYGAEAAAVAELAARSPDLLEPVVEGLSTLKAELLFGALHEGAAGVDDLLDRRTRIGLVPADRERAVEAAQTALDHALAPA